MEQQPPLARTEGLVDMFEDVRQFQQKFGLEYGGSPRALPMDLTAFRVGFLQEEFQEYCEASDDGDLERMLDALVDLVYVALGTAYQHGFDFNEAWRRVHAANMAKVRVERASDSKRGSTYDVVKPAGWRAPDLSDLVRP